MRHLILFGVAGLALAGCPDNVRGRGGQGGAPGAGDAAGSPAGNSNSDEGGSAASALCYEDSECPDGSYCEFEGLSGVCVEGCREGGAGCAPGQTCDPETRLCAYPPCEDDAQCPEGTFCGADDACVTGCRLDDPCPGAAPDGRALACDPETRECVAHSPCCVPAGGAESCELAASAAQCEAKGGQLLAGALLCDDEPCTQRCELDADCEELDVGGATFYCDPADLRCREGCREGDCAGDLVCDTARRVCVSQPCVATADCADGQYCEPTRLVCVTGCGADADCPAGLGCVNNACVDRCDPAAMDCASGQYCDAQTRVCRAQCEANADCGDAEACDPVTRQCVRGLCRDDEPLGDLSGEPNSTFATASQLTLTPIPSEPGKSSARAQGRVICGADVDLYRLSLAQGERMRLTLSHDAGADLALRVFSERDPLNPVAVTPAARNPDQLVYPAEGEVLDAQAYFIEVGGALDAADRVSYDLSVQTAPVGDACFSDIRETGDGDDSYATATALVPNGSSRFDDASVCVGDQDWFVLPLTVNDGLSVRLTTDLGAQPVRFELYPRAALGGILGTPAPSFVVTEDESTDDLDLGLRVYALSVARGSSSFSVDGDWVIAVKPGAPGAYASYAIEVVHEADGGVCVNEGREPNDSVGAGVDLARVFGFQLDNAGLLAQGRENRVADGVICSGDSDYYCVGLAAGDVLEAWVKSDAVVGSLEVRLVDAEGGPVGSAPARHTPLGGAPSKVRLLGAGAGEHCVVVDGLANAQGPYELTVVRSVPAGGVCASDEAGAANNTAAAATPLMDVSAGLGLRFEQRNGLMCDAAADPADWYSFPVAQAGSAVCVMLEGFSNDVADLDIEVFGVPNTSTEACTTDAACVAIGATACIAGRCQTEDARSTFTFDFELAAPSRLGVRAGQQYARVHRGGVGQVSPYDLSVTVTPPAASCVPDWQEAGDPNDNGGLNASGPSRATVLGSGAVGLCDAWLCNPPEGAPDVDWYKITVPSGEDRTVLITFDAGNDGPLQLYYWGETTRSAGRNAIGNVAVPVVNYQCLNLRGGAGDLEAELGVAVNGASASFGPDNRIDYSLRVVPTDLSVTPTGACPLLGAGAIPACTPQYMSDNENEVGIFTTECWPTLALP